MADCIFCKIIAGESPSYTIHEDDDFKVILDMQQEFQNRLILKIALIKTEKTIQI